MTPGARSAGGFRLYSRTDEERIRAMRDLIAEGVAAAEAAALARPTTGAAAPSVRSPDAEADRLIALYKSHRPNDSFGDLAAVMSGDNSALRTSAYVIAERKFAQGRAPAYLYYFNWRSPVRNGKLRTMH